MAAVTGLIDNVFFVRWEEQPTVPAIESITGLLQNAYAELSDSLVYVATIPRRSPPDAAARTALKEGTESATRYCSSIHIVIEGEGMRRALIRSVSAGLLLATGLRGKGFHIHENVADALASASGMSSRPLDANDVLERARVAGYLGAEVAAQAVP